MGARPTDSQNNAQTGASTVLEKIERSVDSARVQDRWNPPFLGDIDMRIAADGTWYYSGTPIRRERLVRLFSGILRCEEDGRFYLVTPVEKFGICVEEAPFQAVEMSVEGRGRDQIIRFRTNVDDMVCVDRQHPLRFARIGEAGDVRPYVTVRDRLEALVSRPVYYDLVELGTTRARDGGEDFGVWSSGEFYVMADAAGLDL